MSAGRWDISLTQGETWRRILTVKNGSGQIVSYADRIIRSQIRNSTNTAILQTLTCSTDAEGRIILLLSKEQTESLTVTTDYGQCPHRLSLESELQNGEVEALAYGDVTVRVGML